MLCNEKFQSTVFFVSKHIFVKYAFSDVVRKPEKSEVSQPKGMQKSKCGFTLR